MSRAFLVARALLAMTLALSMFSAAIGARGERAVRAIFTPQSHSASEEAVVDAKPMEKGASVDLKRPVPSFETPEPLPLFPADFVEGEDSEDERWSKGSTLALLTTTSPCEFEGWSPSRDEELERGRWRNASGQPRAPPSLRS